MSPAQQRAYLSCLSNLIKAGKYPKYYQLLTDFNFLKTKLHHPNFGIQALIEDYDLAPSDTFNDEESHTLKLIQGTLRLAAHILIAEPEQLATQLWGRMQGFAIPAIQSLLQAAEQQQSQPWLKPLTTSFTPPGGNLLRTFTGHSNWVNAVAVSPDGEKVISGSRDKTVKVWDINNGRLINSFTGDSYIPCCAITPDGSTIIAGEASGQLHFLRLQELANNQESQTTQEMVISQ